ncbi:hypothetical protein LPJ56_007049, partial [Coemansia sp. RSA 2599]
AMAVVDTAPAQSRPFAAEALAIQTETTSRSGRKSLLTAPLAEASMEVPMAVQSTMARTRTPTGTP